MHNFKHFARCLLVVLGLVATSGASAQEVPKQVAPPNSGAQPLSADKIGTSAAVPDWIIYHAFFAHIDTLDAFAEKLQAEGKQEAADAFRTHDQRWAKLTEQEGTTMKQIARASNLESRATNERITALMKQANAAHQQATGAGTPPPSAELQQAYGDLQNSVNSRVAELRDRLGNTSFQKLDKYVRSIIVATPSSPKPPQLKRDTLPLPGGAR